MVVKMTVTGIHNSLLIAYAPISTVSQMIRYYAVLRNVLFVSKSINSLRLQVWSIDLKINF